MNFLMFDFSNISSIHSTWADGTNIQPTGLFLAWDPLAQTQFTLMEQMTKETSEYV